MDALSFSLDGDQAVDMTTLSLAFRNLDAIPGGIIGAAEASKVTTLDFTENCLNQPHSIAIFPHLGTQVHVNVQVQVKLQVHIQWYRYMYTYAYR